MAPSTNCLAPIGTEAILKGLLSGIKAERIQPRPSLRMCTTETRFRSRSVFAYGGEPGKQEDYARSEKNGKTVTKTLRKPEILRFANRVPLLYQQSALLHYTRAVIDTGMEQVQPVPVARVSFQSRPRWLFLIHMASVWVPFTSESKEAIADYDEIRKEIKLGISECGRRLGMLLRRKRKKHSSKPGGMSYPLHRRSH